MSEALLLGQECSSPRDTERDESIQTALTLIAHVLVFDLLLLFI